MNDYDGRMKDELEARLGALQDAEHELRASIRAMELDHDMALEPVDRAAIGRQLDLADDMLRSLVAQRIGVQTALAPFYPPASATIHVHVT